MSLRTPLVLAVLAIAVALTLGSQAARAGAEGVEEATWRLEQPSPPPPPTGVQGSSTPIGLGRIGDIEFWAPNRGLLITAGNPPTIPPGLWFYNGVSWHELTGPGPAHEGVCGATDGRIAWAGPDEFWTISDGRPGQAAEETGRAAPLEDNTLCHFSGGQVITSYASPAFQASSYQAMHAAGCFGPSDCWFAGDPLPEPLTGAFQLHWNGHSLAAEPNPQGHAVEDMTRFGNYLYEGVRIAPEDRLSEEESAFATSEIHLIAPEGVQPTFFSLPSREPEGPFYTEGEFATALDFPHLSGGESALWGAANPTSPTPTGSKPGEVTIARDSEGVWSQIVGPSADPSGNPFTKFISKATSPTQAERQKERENEVVNSIAAEPGSESSWVALSSPSNSDDGPVAHALLARISSNGTVSEQQALPSGEGVGPKGVAQEITCPAPEDCWMATAQGWLFHLTTPAARAAEEAAPDTDPAFANLITYRPPDEGLPQVPPDAPPVDDSGLLGESPSYGGTFAETTSPLAKPRIRLPLLSRLHSRLVGGDTLELRFHLAVKARVRLLAERRKKLVASTATHTLAAGNRRLLLRLNPREWPTKLSLQTHALAPLPTVTVKGSVGGPEHGGAGSNTVSTGLTVLPHLPSFAELGSQP